MGFMIKTALCFQTSSTNNKTKQDMYLSASERFHGHIRAYASILLFITYKVTETVTLETKAFFHLMMCQGYFRSKRKSMANQVFAYVWTERGMYNSAWSQYWFLDYPDQRPGQNMLSSAQWDCFLRISIGFYVYTKSSIWMLFRCRIFTLLNK